ncbi:hypothetical protein [Frateuria defendens]|uniref:hypothetical protein n=1 Tax=Frateuria defendens TaxID=2219559 RepID=UPI00066FB614|nr:hypothetical protein [Frateuria defendens]
MKRATRQRLGLLIGVAALLGLAGWQWQHDSAAAPGALLDLDPAAISRVAVQLGHGPAEDYLRRDGHWWRADAPAVRADDGRLDELAATARAPVLAWRAAADFDPAKIGLAPPQATLRLDGRELTFGETAVTGPQRYVRVGDRVALVPERYMPRPALAQTTRAH